MRRKALARVRGAYLGRGEVEGGGEGKGGGSRWKDEVEASMVCTSFSREASPESILAPLQTSAAAPCFTFVSHGWLEWAVRSCKCRP